MKRCERQLEKPSIPGFTLLSCCGFGTVSEVWLATDRRRNLQAVRLVSKNRSPELLKAERRGVVLYRSLCGDHANLLRILDFGETPDYLYSVTEPADNISRAGGRYEPDTLSGRMKYCKLTIGGVMKYLQAILEGMGHLHDRNMAHCDLKPENILFVNGVPKIGDPGLVSPLGLRSAGGTAGFRPPWPASGMECDIHAFGKMIYMLCTRENPQRFPEIPERCDLSAFMPLNEIALGCCESRPDRRFLNADEIRRELSRVRLGAAFQELRRRAE